MGGGGEVGSGILSPCHPSPPHSLSYLAPPRHTHRLIPAQAHPQHKPCAATSHPPSHLAPPNHPTHLFLPSHPLHRLPTPLRLPRPIPPHPTPLHAPPFPTPSQVLAAMILSLKAVMADPLECQWFNMYGSRPRSASLHPSSPSPSWRLSDSPFRPLHPHPSTRTCLFRQHFKHRDQNPGEERRIWPGDCLSRSCTAVRFR